MTYRSATLLISVDFEYLYRGILEDFLRTPRVGHVPEG